MPPLPQSIALHIGAHKTASSHLQNMLYRNREMISNAGIRVYGPGYLRVKGRNLAAMFGLSWSEGPAPRRDPHEQLKFLAKGRERLVFTEENFTGNLTDSNGRTSLPLYPSGAERVAELVSRWAPVDTQLFLAVRNPATFMASTYSQALFGGVNIDPHTFRARNDWQRIDWADYVAQLRAIPGLGTIYLWRQEDYDRSHDLILRHLLRWTRDAQVEAVKSRMHQGLSAAAVDQTLAWMQTGKSGPLARDARHAFPVGPDHPAFQLYASETLAEAQAIYDAQMARIAKMTGLTLLHPPQATHKG